MSPWQENADWPCYGAMLWVLASAALLGLIVGAELRT